MVPSILAPFTSYSIFGRHARRDFDERQRSDRLRGGPSPPDIRDPLVSLYSPGPLRSSRHADLPERGSYGGAPSDSVGRPRDTNLFSGLGRDKERLDARVRSQWRTEEVG